MKKPPRQPSKVKAAKYAKAAELMEDLDRVQQEAWKSNIEIRFSESKAGPWTYFHVMFERDRERVANYWPSNGTIAIPRGLKSKVSSLAEALQVTLAELEKRIMRGNLPRPTEMCFREPAQIVTESPEASPPWEEEPEGVAESTAEFMWM